MKATRAHQSHSNEEQKPARDCLSDPRTRAGGLCQSAIFLTLAGRGCPLDRAANTNAQRVRYLRGRSQTLEADTMSESESSTPALLLSHALCKAYAASP